jgi:hypothetical protein
MQGTVGKARASLQEIERTYQQLRGQIQEVEVELKIKSEEDNSVLQEWENKRVEFSRLSSSRSAIQRAQQDFEAARQGHDDFMELFGNKSTDLKKQLKVS